MVVPSTAKFLFNGKRVYIWMLVPLVDSLFSMSQLPVLYNNKFFAYFFDPFYGTDYGGSLQVNKDFLKRVSRLSAQCGFFL